MVIPGAAPARTMRYQVEPEDSVHALAPRRGLEFLLKPPVMASAKLLELAEGICMEAMRADLSPGQCSLGTRQHAVHLGAVEIGATLVVTARRTGGDGRRSEWHVAIREEPGSDDESGTAPVLVWEGALSFAVVDRRRFEREKLKRRTIRAARPPRTARVRAPRRTGGEHRDANPVRRPVPPRGPAAPRRTEVRSPGARPEPEPRGGTSAPDARTTHWPRFGED
uniref:thioesterase family protein n=1 Tax=Amycolatopsis sp. CA-096443 TaxID=3239919 RepID=UPI003F49854F